MSNKKPVLYIGFTEYGRIDKVCESSEEAMKYEQSLKDKGLNIVRSNIYTDKFEDAVVEPAYKTTNQNRVLH